jgi:hypothetical protein
MLPNSCVLNALASLCEKLETDEPFQEKRKELQELCLEHRNLVERRYDASDRPELRLQMEAQAEHMGIAMVGLLAQLLKTKTRSRCRFPLDNYVRRPQHRL